MAQPKGFIDHKRPNHVFRLKKALYGLKQAPRAWYERLTKHLLEKGYIRGGADRTLFVKHYQDNFIVAQIYVDDIVFGATHDNDASKFAETIESEFVMSMMGELTYFLGLQVKQSDDGIHLCQSKYAKELVKKFGLENSKDFPTPMGTSNIGLGSDSLGESVD